MEKRNKRRWESERLEEVFWSRKKERNEMEGRCLWDEEGREKRKRESERGLPWDNNTQKYWEHCNAGVLWIGPAGEEGGCPSTGLQELGACL